MIIPPSSNGTIPARLRRDSTLPYGPGVDGTYSHDEASIVTINRLGLIAPAYTKIKTFEPGGQNIHGDWGPTQDDVLVYGDLGSVVFTPLGEAFYRAVMPATCPKANPET